MTENFIKWQAARIAELEGRLTALESERDALLAAAGKEAVAVAWFDKERNTVWWKDGLVNADFRDGQPFFTAPQASEGKGEHVAYQWKNKVFGNWVFANDIHHAEMMRQHGHETRALVVAAPQAECAPCEAPTVTEAMLIAACSAYNEEEGYRSLADPVAMRRAIEQAAKEPQ